MKLLKNLSRILFPAFYQTKDNNITLENQLENEILTEDFFKRKEEFENKNVEYSLNLLKKYEIQKELDNTTILITDKEAKIRAAKTFLTLAQMKLIDDLGHIASGIMEVIEEEIC